MRKPFSFTKKSLFTFILGVSLFLSPFVPATTYASVRSEDIMINGKAIPFDDLYKDDDYNLYIPLDFLQDQLGLSYQYNRQTRIATIKFDNKTIKMKVDSKLIIVNGERKKLGASVLRVGDKVVVPLVEVAECLEAKMYFPWFLIEEQDVEEQKLYKLRAKTRLEKKEIPVTKKKDRKNRFGLNLSASFYEPASIYGSRENLDVKLQAGLGVIYHYREYCDIELRLGQWSLENSWYSSVIADAWEYLRSHYGATCADYSSNYRKIKIRPLYLHIVHKFGSYSRRDNYSHIKKMIPYIGAGWGYYTAEVIYEQLDVNGVNEFGFNIRNDFDAPHLITGTEYYFSPNKSFKFELIYHLGNEDFAISPNDLSGGSGISGITESDRQEIIDSYINEFNSGNTKLDLRRLACGLSYTYHY